MLDRLVSFFLVTTRGLHQRDSAEVNEKMALHLSWFMTFPKGFMISGFFENDKLLAHEHSASYSLKKLV